jgi:hypothetical protein
VDLLADGVLDLGEVIGQNRIHGSSIRVEG